MKIVATLNEAVQIGPDTFRMEATSRVFDECRTIRDIIEWAKACGLKDVRISQIQLSDYTGESL